MKLLSIIVPCYNEERVIKEFYKQTLKTLAKVKENYELIFINDGSVDQTLPILKKLAQKNKKVKIINFSRNFGHQIAITAGMDFAKGNAVVIIDADLQDPPMLILQMLKKWKEGYEVVYAQRKKRKGESFFKTFSAKLFYRLMKKLTNIDIPLNTGDFRLMDKKIVEVLRNIPERNRFVRGLVSWVGYKQTAVEFERESRFAGESKYPLSKMLLLAKDGIFSFSDKPLSFITKLGLLCFFISLGFIVWALYLKLILLDPSLLQGWTSLFIVSLFLGGIQLLSIGILGEYISRIYTETKHRPIYIVKEKINLNK